MLEVRDITGLPFSPAGRGMFGQGAFQGADGSFYSRTPNGYLLPNTAADGDGNIIYAAMWAPGQWSIGAFVADEERFAQQYPPGYWNPRIAAGYPNLGGFGTQGGTTSIFSDSVALDANKDVWLKTTQGWQRAFLLSAPAGGDPDNPPPSYLVPESHVTDLAYSGLTQWRAHFGGYSTPGFIGSLLENPLTYIIPALAFAAPALLATEAGAAGVVEAGAATLETGALELAPISEEVLTPTVAAGDLTAATPALTLTAPELAPLELPPLPETVPTIPDVAMTLEPPPVDLPPAPPPLEVTLPEPPLEAPPALPDLHIPTELKSLVTKFAQGVLAPKPPAPAPRPVARRAVALEAPAAQTSTLTPGVLVGLGVLGWLLLR